MGQHLFWAKKDKTSLNASIKHEDFLDSVITAYKYPVARSLKRKKQSLPSNPRGLILTAGSHEKHSPGSHFLRSSLERSTGALRRRLPAAHGMQVYLLKTRRICLAVSPVFFHAGSGP